MPTENVRTMRTNPFNNANAAPQGNYAKKKPLNRLSESQIFEKALREVESAGDRPGSLRSLCISKLCRIHFCHFLDIWDLEGVPESLSVELHERIQQVQEKMKWYVIRQELSLLLADSLSRL